MNIDLILDARASPRDLAELGQLAEANGIRGMWLSSLLDSRDPFTNLALLATSTKRLLLGPAAVNPYDIHPVRIASAFLTLNELAHGRARIVIGGGGEALAALGIKPERRVRAVAECVDIIKAAASGEPVNYGGELYQVSNLKIDWANAPAPPVFIGASHEQMLRMAARVSDGIMMSDMPVPLAANAIATLDAALAKHGKARPAFQTNAFAAWHVQEDRAALMAEARQWLVLRGIFRPHVLATFLDREGVTQVMNNEAAFWTAFRERTGNIHGVDDTILDALVKNLTFVATPAHLDQIIAKLGKYKDAGLGSMSLRLYANPDQSIKLIGERVIPALNG